ncbi:MAG: hypothetical protein WAT70_12255 [Rhizobiaceae bacterium]
MTIFARLFRTRNASIVSTLARRRLGATMPGETAALAANRYGVLVA